MNDPQGTGSAAIPLRMVPVHQVGSEPATHIPADETGPHATDAHEAADLAAGAPGPRDLDSVLASLRGSDSHLAFSEAAGPGPCIDAIDGPDGDAD